MRKVISLAEEETLFLLLRKKRFTSEDKIIGLELVVTP